MSEYSVNGCGCVSNAKVYGLDESIRRAKFPMRADIEKATNKLTKGIAALAQSERGSGHDQWLTGVIVQFDLTFSNKAFIEAERYHFFDFVSSQSTMHRIASFDMGKCYNEYVDSRIVEIMKEKVRSYNDYCLSLDASAMPQSQEVLNEIAQEKRKKYLEILYSNPAGCRITAGMTTNYRQLKTIHAQRKNHKLPEWREFCKWIETLPYSQLITNQKGNNLGDE